MEAGGTTNFSPPPKKIGRPGGGEGEAPKDTQERKMSKLHELLTYAEGLGMPEGEYVTVCNALKTAFNKTPVATKHPFYQVVETHVLERGQYKLELLDCFDTTIEKAEIYVNRVCKAVKDGTDYKRSLLECELVVTYKNKPTKTRNITLWQGMTTNEYLSVFQPMTVIVTTMGFDVEYKQEETLKKLKEEHDKYMEMNELDDDEMSDWDKFIYYDCVLQRLKSICFAEYDNLTPYDTLVAST
jgi:hypothetical protein